MARKKGQAPESLPDEKLDEAAGGLLPAVQASRGTTTSFTCGVYVASGDVNNDGAALKIADGSVKPGA